MIFVAVSAPLDGGVNHLIPALRNLSIEAMETSRECRRVRAGMAFHIGMHQNDGQVSARVDVMKAEVSLEAVPRSPFVEDGEEI
jgi:hypothetical protein